MCACGKMYAYKIGGDLLDIRLQNQIDRSIPYKNIIMRCDEYDIQPIGENDFHIRKYKNGDENYWAEIEYKIGDFNSVEEALDYFVQNYNLDELVNKCFFAETSDGKVVGTCIAWYDNKDDVVVSSLHWLAVLPKYQHQGIGRALGISVMNYYQENGLLPVYLHTQPWSYKAIKLYYSIGFNIQHVDTFGNYKNEYKEAKEILSNYLPLEILI